MASSRSLIERFRTQRPTSRRRNRQREKGEVRQTWWKDGVNDGVEEEYGRHEQRRSVLPQASSLKTRTAPVRFSDSLDEPLPSPPTYKYNDADETMMKDILAYGNQRQRARGVRDSLTTAFRPLPIVLSDELHRRAHAFGYSARGPAQMKHLSLATQVRSMRRVAPFASIGICSWAKHNSQQTDPPEPHHLASPADHLQRQPRLRLRRIGHDFSHATRQARL